MTKIILFKYLAMAIIALGFTIGGLMVIPASAQSTVSIDNLSAGDLIRGQSFSAVYYYGADGFRYVFTNDKAFFTWYDNFDNVKWVSDADLGKIQIGGNVTYKPGVKMIKITTDPKTYAVAQGGELRHVTSESIAIALYGSNWNQMIDDVQDGFFSNYNIGDPILSETDYDAAAAEVGVTDINDDKDLVAPKEITISANGYSDVAVTISAGQTVKWTNTDSEKHSVTSDDLRWGSGTMQTDGFWVRRFEDPGTYTYYDSYASQFTGTVIVQ